MDHRRNNPEATINVIRQIIGPLRKKEIGIGQAYAMMNILLGISKEEARPLIEPTREESRPATSAAERAHLFIEWQLKDTRHKNVNWREALEAVRRVMNGEAVHPDLLNGDGLPLPEGLTHPPAESP